MAKTSTMWGIVRFRHSSDGSVTFGYSYENRLTSAGGALSATLSYDPLARPYQVGNC